MTAMHYVYMVLESIDMRLIIKSSCLFFLTLNSSCTPQKETPNSSSLFLGIFQWYLPSMTSVSYSHFKCPNVLDILNVQSYVLADALTYKTITTSKIVPTSFLLKISLWSLVAPPLPPLPATPPHPHLPQAITDLFSMFSIAINWHFLKMYINGIT